MLHFFAVWFLAAVIKGNDLLISFTGFLLSFTKITGFAFLCVFSICLYDNRCIYQ